MVVLTGCNSGTVVESADEASAGGAAETEYSLPFGLEQVKGTVPVARPVVAEQSPTTYNGEPIRWTSLRAAYNVTGSPQEAMAAWSAQFAELGIGEVSVSTPSMHESDGPLPWLALSANGQQSYANAELWSTTDEPILLIEVDLPPDIQSVPASPPELPELPAAPAPMPTAIARNGDTVFGPHGAEVHLPTGSEQVMPSVPSKSGTDGEVVILTTDDPMATVRALVKEAYDFNEAQPQHEPGSIDGPHEGEFEGAKTVTAGFDSGAGGWGFTVLASQGPDDERASVWVRTYAD
jgi:hypothetical protein